MFWAELKRRKVIRVAVAYAIVAWLLVQIIVSIEAPLNLPDWTDTFVIVLLAVGFVVSLVLAWAYDLTPDGIVQTDAGEAAGSRTPLGSYIAIATGAALLGALTFWFLNRDADTRWLLEEVIPQIEDALAVADWDTAYQLAVAAESRMPDNEQLDELWPRITWRVTIPSDPPGATVYRRAYANDDGEWQLLGQTPLQDIRFPYGLSHLRFELDGHRTLHRTLGGGHINWEELAPGQVDGLLVRVTANMLDTPDTLPDDMVRVPGWTMVLDGEATELADFFLERHEVSNAEFKRFVDSGGYGQRSLWDDVLDNGAVMPWQEAMNLFRDTTGRHGPATWEAGDFPAGKADAPVSGVSWYEARAYARFMGRELPTVHHWQQALSTAEFPWLLPVSNFGGDGPRATSDSRAMSYTGAFDMTGNVREWTVNGIGTDRIILGGSFNDPYYVAGVRDIAASPLDRSAGNGLRLMVSHDDVRIAERARAAVAGRLVRTPTIQPEPVSDEVFAAFGRVFDYDKGPLDALVEDTVETRVWTRERISFNAGYGAQRMLLYLYLPTNVAPPYQPIIYWPGWDTFRLDDIDQYFAKQVDFILKSGRAVAFPIYSGTFERRVGNVRERPDFDTAAYRDNTIETVKDLRRTIDYLESRRDVSLQALSYFGYSWGGVNGPTVLAQEPRIRSAVINIGLLPPMASTPEVDPVNALPRVRVPTLMFSGEFDGLVPIENARRYFDLIGVPDNDKKHVVAIGGHFIPRDLLIRETLDWFDRHLGAP